MTRFGFFGGPIPYPDPTLSYICKKPPRTPQNALRATNPTGYAPVPPRTASAALGGETYATMTPTTTAERLPR